MSHNEKEQAEKAQQQKSIEYFRGLGCSVIAHFMVGRVPVVERKQRLYNSRDPEKSHQSAYEHEHFPLSDLGAGQMAFCKNNTYNKKGDGFHQLKKL